MWKCENLDFCAKIQWFPPGCDLTTISNISKIHNFYSENPDFWHGNSKLWWLKLSKSLSFSLGRTHLIFSNFLCILHLVKTRCQKGHYLDTGAKIHILSKNSNLQVLIFDKIPHFKNLIFHMIHITKISHLTKFNPIIHEIHIFQGSDFGILKQKMHIFVEFEKLRFWSLGFEILEKCEVLKQRINEDFRTLDEFWKKRFEIRFLSERSEPRLSKKMSNFIGNWKRWHWQTCQKSPYGHA